MEKMSNKKWLPPEVINKDDLIKISDQVLEQPDIPIKESNEDIFRIRELEMDWDIATEIVNQ